MPLRRYVLQICYDLITEKLHYTTATQYYDAYITVPFLTHTVFGVFQIQFLLWNFIYIHTHLNGNMYVRA